MTDVRGPRRMVAAVATVALLATGSATAAVAAEGSTPAPLGAGDARALLTAAAASLAHPHVGRVSVVSFTAAGPRVADLEVRVDAMGTTELRRPTRWLLGGGDGVGWLRTTEGVRSATPSTVGAGLDVDVVLERWDARVGPPRGLDTGPATPVHLVRREGTPIEEVVYVDEATGLPVRRETRGVDGAVLRVVAYTSVSMVELGAPSAVAAPEVAVAVDVDALAHDGYEVPRSLGAGFTLLGAEHADGMVVARYGDGLSVLSVYQQHGRLDQRALAGATVREVAGRDVFTWPGSEPLPLVWTGGDRTWTVVSDAPLPVIEDAVASLPGDHVGHDVPSRISRGLARAWQWLRGVVGAPTT